MEQGMQKVLDIITMVFDTIKKYLLMFLGESEETKPVE